MELVENKKRSELGGGRVKGSEVERGGERKMASWEREIKAHGGFPSGYGRSV